MRRNMAVFPVPGAAVRLYRWIPRVQSRNSVMPSRTGGKWRGGVTSASHCSKRPIKGGHPEKNMLQDYATSSDIQLCLAPVTRVFQPHARVHERRGPAALDRDTAWTAPSVPWSKHFTQSRLSTQTHDLTGRHAVLPRRPKVFLRVCQHHHYELLVHGSVLTGAEHDAMDFV